MSNRIEVLASSSSRRILAGIQFQLAEQNLGLDRHLFDVARILVGRKRDRTAESERIGGQ